MPDEATFLEGVTAALARLPGVEAVALGGSRAQGTARPDSDWDLAVYYREGFDPASLRALGWPGTVSELGGWGGGVFNGGGWLEVDGRRVDMRDIACPLFLLGGATDHITPPVQVFAAADFVSTPADQVVRRTAPGGHLGLFMGNQALRHEWPPLMAAVAEHSRRTD